MLHWILQSGRDDQWCTLGRYTQTLSSADPGVLGGSLLTNPPQEPRGDCILKSVEHVGEHFSQCLSNEVTTQRKILLRTRRSGEATFLKRESKQIKQRPQVSEARRGMFVDPVRRDPEQDEDAEATHLWLK